MFSMLRSLFGQTSAKSPAKSRVRNRGAGSLPGLETLESRLTPSAVTENQVVNLFRVFLDRVPHSSTLSSWSRALDSGRISVAQLADQLLQSPEYGNRVVKESFSEYLGRAPGAGGLASYVSALGHGVSQERLDASILGSKEYFANHGSGNIPFVESLYTKVLGRSADAAGLEGHVAQLVRGASRTQVAYAFLSSAEHGRQVTAEAYQAILGREPRALEIYAWSGLYSRSTNGPKTVWAGVAASPEGTESLSAPGQVQNLSVAATGVGSLLLSWDAPVGGGATSYTVTMTTIAGFGSSSQTQVTTNTSLSYTGLLPSNSYAFSVTASNASGTGIAAQTSFGQAPISLLYPAVVAASGQDGSIWVVNYKYTVDDAGEPAVEESSLQQIVNKGGIWTAQPGIEFPYLIKFVTPGLDGSIWVANWFDNSVQQIVNTNGVLMAQPAIVVSSGRNTVEALTTGLDGSIWVAYPNAVRQIVNQGGVWTAQPPISPKGDDFYPESLTPGLDGSIWAGSWGADGLASAVLGQVQQIVNQGGVWAVQPGIKVGQKVNKALSAPYDLTTGLDGSIWAVHGGDFLRSYVQQIVNKSGVWTAQPMMDMLGSNGPSALTTGLDGSIWVLNSGSGGPSPGGSVQQIVNNNGVWTAQPVIRVGNASAFTTGQDGSIWVANTGASILDESTWETPGNVQQIVLPPQSGPKDLKAVSGPATGEMTLSWQPPPADGGTPVIYYTVTALQGMTSQTILTSATSVTFSGLASGEGTTYFTVTATNFAGTSPTAGLLLGPDGKPLPTTNSGIGIVSDGTPFVGGGFDGAGNAYSWEALGGAPTLGWNGVTFDLGSPNLPNFTRAAGQKIDVAQGDFNTLNLAGAAVNGSQANQQITLTYTDGSTVVWAQSFSDWCSPQNYGHEAIVSTQAYRDTSSGGTNQTTNHVYGYSYTIPSGKTLASITLPTNPNVRLLDIQMSNSTSVNLSNAYTSWGIANGNTQVANHQGFDGGGYYYYSGNLQSLIAWSGATFYLGPVPNSKNGQNNFVQGKGQTIDLPQGDFGWLYLAGAAANGNQTTQAMTLTFSDGSTDTWTQSFSDWCGPQNYAGESIIQMQPNWVNQVGNVHSQTNYVYGYAYQIPAGKTLTSVTLPNNSNLGILGMAMVTAVEPVTTVPVIIPGNSTYTTNEPMVLTAYVAAQSGSVAPTGSVDFYASNSAGVPIFLGTQTLGATATSFQSPTSEAVFTSAVPNPLAPGQYNVFFQYRPSAQSGFEPSTSLQAQVTITAG